MELSTSFLPAVENMNCSQLSQLYHAMFMVPVTEETVAASITTVCGTIAKTVARSHILPVLQEIHDRRVLEDNAYWDFRALVMNDNQTLAPKDALLFLRVLHGSKFSSDHWQQFLGSRVDRGADVSWCEIRPWVCSIPEHGDADSANYKQLESDISSATDQRSLQMLQEYEKRNQTKHSKENYEHSQRTKRKAQDKLNAWEAGGLAFLLTDDDENLMQGKSNWLKRNVVVATDILDLIEQKYSRLRYKLLSLMMRLFSGETTWEIMSDSERYDLVDELVAEERRLRLLGVLPNQYTDLPGASITVKSEFPSLRALMDVAGIEKKHADILRAGDYWQQISEQKDNLGKHLVDLMFRCKQELQNFSSNIRVSKKKYENEALFCQLHRQLIAIESQSAFRDSTLVVGLIERSSFHEYQEIDWVRREYLASAHLSSLQPHRSSAAAVSATMTTTELISLSLSDLFILLIKQIHERHTAESMLMGKLLHHRTAKYHKSAQKALAKEDVIQQLTILASQRTAWRDANDEYKALQRDEHVRILQKALSIYYDAEAKPRFSAGSQKLDREVNTSIFSLLQQKQGQEFDTIIDEISREQRTKLIETLKREEAATIHEYSDNIAAILFGSVESSELDRLYVEQLNRKYLAIRHKVIQYSLSKKYGDSWYSRSVEDRQRHIAKSATELKELQDQGKVAAMDAAMGDTLQTISVYQCLGENRLQFEKRITSGQPHAGEVVPKETGVFTALHSRYFGEYAAVLDHAHKTGETDPDMLLALLKTETFVIEQAGDLRIACFLSGLMERVHAVIGNRHDEDQIRVGNLAKCLVSNHALLWRLFEKQSKLKSDIYCNDQSSLSEWVECVLKELFLKHSDERFTLLSILLDDGLQELREVADLLSNEEQYKRLVALQNKQRWLLFESNSDRDDNIGILEEAAAIQMCLLSDSQMKLNLPADNESISTIITERLLLIQEKELAYMIKNIEGASKEDLMKMHRDEMEARATECCNNVAKVLTSYTGVWSDDLIISEIEAKYKHLESLMVETTLMKQNTNWSGLSADAQAQLEKDLREQTEKLRLAGDVTELINLYRPVFADENVFFAMFGDNSFEFSKKIVDFQNVDNVPEDIYSVTEDAVVVHNPLAALTERKEEEKQAYQNLLRGMYEVHLGEQGRAAEVIRLRHQQTLIRRSKDFSSLSLRLGVGERAQLISHICKGLGDHKMMSVSDWSRLVRLSRKTNEEIDFSDVNLNNIAGESADTVTLFVETLQLYAQRHKQELARLTQLMSSLPQVDVDAASMQLFDEKIQQLCALHQSHSKQANPWSDKDVRFSCALKLKLWEEFSADDTPTNCIIAELTEKQMFESSNLIFLLSNKSIKDLQLLKQSFQMKYHACVYEALTDTSHFMKKMEEQITEAMENRYDALKDKLLLDALMEKIGDAEWSQLSDDERQQHLRDLKLKEQQFRQNGRFDEANDFLDEHLRNTEAFKNLVLTRSGESDSLMKERLKRRKDRIAEGMSMEEADKLEQEEAEKDEAGILAKSPKPHKVLEDWRKQDIDDIMAQLQKYKDAEDKLRREPEELARIRRDQRRIRMEERYSAADALMKILREQVLSEEEARRLQEQLARERLAARRGACKNGTVPEEIVMPESDDILALKEAVLAELDLKHLEEREMLLKLTELAPSTDFYSTSLNTDNTKQEVVLADLGEQRRQLREDPSFNGKDQEPLLQEGVCYKWRLREFSLKGEDLHSEADDVITSLLADLQQLQMKETETVSKDCRYKAAKPLRDVKGLQLTARTNCWYDNVSAAILTIGSISEALNPQQEVINALNQKYDSIKDKLILEGLMNQMGEAEWANLSEKEKQQRLMDLKMQEKRLRGEGKVDEARKLINDLVDAEQGIDSMKADQERLLRDRAEQLRKRLQSKSGDQEKISQELEEVEEKLKRTSVLDNLEYELEGEKERLLALLNSQKDDAAAERIKQLELAKLRRQKKMLKRDEELDEVSALMHLAMKNEENRLAGLESDKDLQMELARRRLAARRGKLGARVVTPEEDTTDVAIKVEDRVLEALERKHSAELNLLMGLLTNAEDIDNLEQVNHISSVKLRKVLEDLETQATSLQEVCKNHTGDFSKEKADLQKLLSKALLYHLTVSLRAAHGDDLQEHTPERVKEVSAAILAQVQEKQDSESGDVDQLIVKEDDGSLEKLADAYNSATDRGQYPHFVSTLFSILDDEKKWTATHNMASVEERFEREKQALLDSINSGDGQVEKDGKMVDAQEMLQKLEAEHAAQKNAFAIQMKKQDEMMMARRKARKQARFEDSSNIAKQLLEEAKANKASHASAQEDDKNKQGDIMREKLAKRREARARKEEMERQEELERASAKNAFNKVGTVVPPIMAMKRERTVVQVSEEQNQQELSKLIEEKHHADKHMSAEQQKQEEMMRARRELRKQRQNSEVEAIFSMGERQKTMFERSSSENREKQMSMMKDRIARIKNEKTVVGRPTRKSTSFEHLMDSSTAGASKDEQMKALAANLQKRFNDESHGMKEGKSSLKLGVVDGVDDGQQTKLLTEQEKQRILKERRLAKRKQKEAVSASAD